MPTKPVSVRFTEKDYAKVNELAKSRGMDLSTFVRECALKSRFPRENSFTKGVKPIIRTMQTSLNMMEQNIDVEGQKEKILKEVKELCSLLN